MRKMSIFEKIREKMKKLLSICIILMASSFALFAINVEDITIQKQESVEGYYQYVGKTAIFWEPKTEDESCFKLGKIQFGIPYEIVNVTGETFTESYSSDTNIKLTFSFKQIGNPKAKPINVIAYNDIYIKGLSLSSAPKVEDFPLYLADEMDAFKKQYVGKQIIDKGEVKEVIDVQFLTMGTSYKYTMPNFIYKSVNTGATSTEMVSVGLGGKYVCNLSRVEKPADESIRYGDTKVIEDSGVTKYSYVDNVIDILIFANNKEFSFILKNISDNSIKVIWNEAAFVDMKGSTSKVMHSGIKYSQKEADQPASVIIRGAKLEDVAVPTSNVSYSSVFKDWITESFTPSTAGLSGIVSLMLPIQIKETINEYIFVFDVNYVLNHPELH